MKKMGLNEIRESYLSFFESKGHLRLPSFSLIPKNDKSLLIINSGMAPLKPYFTGLKVPPRKRVTTCQRCVRTNDVENVGKTIRHGTFFEMLGNFSFGDYFKKEVIPWAWEFLTGVLELPKDKLYITIYEDDEEAFDIWTKNAGVAPSHIFRFGKEENFWEHGTGPCGPCSEIHYNRENTEVKTKEEFLKAGDEDRVVELWNLVFTQFDKDAKGNYNKLKFPNIDTGMGLERIATIMQGTNNIFEVDTIKDIINSVCDMSGEKYGIDDKKDISVRIIVDHIRSITFMISDGILPSNEGRGYVLRRLLRRAERHGKMIGFNEPFLYKVCDSVIKNSCESYPELREREGYIKKVIKIEEERFHETIDIGMNILKGFVNDIKSRNENILSGESAFKLYDTYGFPLELTEEIIEEEGITVDKDSFKKEMEKQRTRAKSAREESNYMGRDIGIIQKIPKETKSEFKGYTNLTCESVVNTIIKGDEFVSILNEGDEGIVVTDETPFYAEMGGQVGDTGIIQNTGMSSEITDCKKNISGKILHFVKVTKGSLKLDDKVRLSVNEIRRKSICKNHTATHILDSALKTVVGDFVKQAGSYVDDIRLRFDFNNFAPLTKEEISKVETIVNANIEKAVSVDTKVMNIEEAKKTGAIALFDDKYKDEVRVVSVGDFSKEFCGGTHVKNSGEIGLFKIVSETGIAAGIRRIEAVTGIEAIKYFEQKEDILNKAQSLLKCSDKEVIQRIEALNKTIKDDNKTISEIKAKLNSGVFDEIVKNSYDVRGVKVAAKVLTDMDADSSRDLADKIKEKLGCGIVILALKDDKKVQFIAMATKEAVSKGIHCGKIVKELSSICQGGGGGRPDMAQAGGKDVSKLDEAVSKIKLIIEKYVK